ncbi:MAG TPA: hypothetical protein VIN75_03075 [Burkholderiaceae bacterium]
MLWFAAAMQGASLAHAAGGASTTVRPSDCRPRDADSTCATAVAGAPAAPPPTNDPALPLYDGPLGGVPPSGYAYWGFDFIAESTGTRSPVRPDEFINRSSVPVTITLSFTFPMNHPCHHDCLPGVEFEVDAGWFKVDPPYVINGNTVSVTQTFGPGRGFGWVIGLWESSNPHLKVTVPQGSAATLEAVGLPSLPQLANEIPATTSQCTCSDGTTASCSDGSRFSNGLLGSWTQNFQTYLRAGAFNDCQTIR